MLISPKLINGLDIDAARKRCRRYRRRILDISQQVTALHIAPAFSCTEITDAIYNTLMRQRTDGSYRDVFMMSKGHGCMIQYVILENKEFSVRRIWTFTASREVASAHTRIMKRLVSSLRPDHSAMVSEWRLAKLTRSNSKAVILGSIASCRTENSKRDRRGRPF